MAGRGRRAPCRSGSPLPGPKSGCGVDMDEDFCSRSLRPDEEKRHQPLLVATFAQSRKRAGFDNGHWNPKAHRGSRFEWSGRAEHPDPLSATIAPAARDSALPGQWRVQGRPCRIRLASTKPEKNRTSVAAAGASGAMSEAVAKGEQADKAGGGRRGHLHVEGDQQAHDRDRRGDAIFNQIGRCT